MMYRISLNTRQI